MGVAPRIPGGGGKLNRKQLGILNTNQFYGPAKASFDVSDLPGYKKFTIDNFALDNVSVTGNGSSTTFSYAITYDANTGIVTLTNNVNTSASGGYHHQTGSVTCFCYYIK